MSDTPRTDAEAFLPHDSKYRVCDADYARQLERELNAAQERINRLEEAGDALANTQTYDLLQTVNWRKAKEAKP